MFIYAVVSLLAVCDGVYWWWADRRLRPLKRSAWWRSGLAVLVGGQLLVLGWWILLPWTLRGLGGRFWVPVTAWLYMWHLLVLPATVVCIALGYVGVGGWAATRAIRDILAGGRGPFRAAAKRDTIPNAIIQIPLAPVATAPTRRQVLGAACAVVPQLVLGGALVRAREQMGQFRIRRFSLAFPSLPKALDGLTIAHVSDTHAGRFVHEAQLEHVAQATIDLNPDLVVFTGDLIDYNLADLPPAVSILRQIEKRFPMAVCVGNHDLFEDARAFRRRLRTAEIPLLTDERRTFRFRGKRLDVLGLDWGMERNPRAAGMDEHMERTLGWYSPATFSLLLAHHPHAFDPAANAGLPLTLAGHTHGGQLMLTESIGAGSAMFKYWSGLYEKPAGTKLVVSNGVGNWFPLRIHAPAEIVHLTLRSA
jgi:predicted MPP superfamily phosphohydrolase